MKLLDYDEPEPDLSWVTAPSKKPLFYDGEPVEGFSSPTAIDLADLGLVMRPPDPSREWLLEFNPIYWAHDLISPFHGEKPTIDQLIKKSTDNKIIIKEKPLEGTGYLIMFRDETGEILVAERLDPKEKRITILHELAHWWLNLPGNLEGDGTPAERKCEDWCETFAQYMECVCS